MTTRKELIVEKYCILEKELLKFIDQDILPDIEDIDICDIVFSVGEYQNVTSENHNDCND